MDTEEKVEKLLDFIVGMEETSICDENGDSRWCERHCQYNGPQKECYRKWLLGERIKP